MEQLTPQLLSVQDESFLKNYIQKQVNKPVFLTLTDNAVSMISVREKKKGISVRLNHIFLKADNKILDEVAGFIKKKSGKIPAIRKFIDHHKSFLKERKPRTITVSTNGKFYNLAEIFESLNRKYFNNRLSASITWGKQVSRYAVKKRTLGSYQDNTNIIRISPVLDRKGVPVYVVEFVVYHEMLHADAGTDLKNKRRVIHTREFKRREKLYKHYERAVNWGKF